MIELTNKLASAERCIEIAEEQLKEHEGVDDNLANMIAKMRVQTQNEFQRYQSEAEAAFQSAVSELLNSFVQGVEEGCIGNKWVKKENWLRKC